MSVLRAIWEAVTFGDFRESLDWMDFTIDLMLSILVLIGVGASVYLVWLLVKWLVYTIYRLVSYDYTIENYSAIVTKREHKPEKTVYRYNPALKIPSPHTCPAEYNVCIVTRNGLKDVIDDKELYHDVRKGSKIRVTMKVGRNRSEEPEIKYWRVTHYSW